MPLLSSRAAWEQADYQRELEAIRLKHDLPALAGAFVTTNGAQLKEATGVRKVGTEIAVTTDDLWHLGSNTKAMTATLIAISVEAGKLRWDSTLSDVFPKLKTLQGSPLAKLSLTHLLTHRSGLPANTLWALSLLSGKPLREQRGMILESVTGLKDMAAPGEQFLYSNLGYVLAAHMLEEVNDRPWEDLMRDQLFKPLGMTQAGFGGTGTLGQTDQPWPHLSSGTPTPKNGPSMDNPPVMAPAGAVHAPMADWASFIAEHLAGVNGKGKLLKAETYQHLHTAPFGGNYAYGWTSLERAWGGKVITHNGTNTMNYSVTWLAPEKGFAMLACTNSGVDKAPKALDEVIGLMMRVQTGGGK